MKKPEEPKNQYVPIRPTRIMKNGKEAVKFVNEEYPNIPEIVQTMEEYKKTIPPSIDCNADHEEILKKYLENIHKNRTRHHWRVLGGRSPNVVSIPNHENLSRTKKNRN
jgi:hypothetical protein